MTAAMKLPPEVGQVVATSSHDSGYRYIVLGIDAQRTELHRAWAVCDLMNSKTRQVFHGHTFHNAFEVDEPTEEEAKLFALYVLAPEQVRKKP